MEEIEDIDISAFGHPAVSSMVFNEYGYVEWVNKAFERLHGHIPDKNRLQSGPSVFDMYASGDAADKLNKCIKENCAGEFTAEIPVKSGKSKWIHVFVTPRFNFKGLPDRFLIVEIDITVFKTKENELQKQFVKMKEITSNLEKVNILLEEQKKEINEQKQTIEDEQKKSEKLLHNIFPFEVAKQLKTKGKAGTRQYKMVSVGFADFKGFSKVSRTLEPKDLVGILDNYFAKFDEIIEKYYLEKIKTIGDAYMFAGGLPLSNKSNPIDAVLASLEIQHYMNTLNDSKVLENLPVWELRIGIHTGPVVAGVVGRKRLAYDIWGDTVNIASRMEQAGHVGMVNVSGVTYSYIKDYFDCGYRGKIETKNQDKTDMYFVNRIIPGYSRDIHGIQPNDLMINWINKL